MERVNGFIKLDSIVELRNIDDFNSSEDLSKFFSKNTNVEVIKHYYNMQIVCSFVHNGIKYFWKYDKNNNPYNQLIIDEIANDLGIPHVPYDLATISNLKGLISQNYKVPDAKYISGKELLSECYELSRIHPHNNLESIWFALENKYHDYPNKQEIVSNIMQKLVSVFILDILTGQLDRHSDNWEVVEYSSGQVDLQPIFDSTRILSIYSIPSITNIALTMYDETSANLGDNLSLFIKDSSSEFVDLLVDSLWVISEENLLKIFKRIEIKTKHQIPKKDKNIYLNKFSEQLEYINQKLAFSRKRNTHK